MQKRLTDWVFAFVHGFRYESSKEQKEQLEFLEPFVKEQVLAKIRWTLTSNPNAFFDDSI